MPDIFVNGDLPQEPLKEDALPHATLSSPGSDVHPNTLSNAQKHARMAQDRHGVAGHTHNVLASYFFYPEPSKVDFVNKDPEETIILLVRRHPITNLPWILMAFILIVTPAFVSVLPFFEGFPERFQLILPIVWYMITAAFTLEKFLTWFFNVNIITDERIIDVDFVHLLYRDISDADIEQIQDVTVKVGGAIRTIFNYGDVHIQTAAEVPEILFEAIPHPDRVLKLLRELRWEEKQEALEGRVR
jgi:hypothetical protein